MPPKTPLRMPLFFLILNQMHQHVLWRTPLTQGVNSNTSMVHGIPSPFSPRRWNQLRPATALLIGNCSLSTSPSNISDTYWTLFSYPHRPQTTNSRTQHTIWSSLSTSGTPVGLHLTVHLCDSTCSQRCGRCTLSCWDQCPLECCPRLWCHGNGPAGRPANPCTPVFSIILTPDTADASSTLWFIHTLQHLYWYTSPTCSTILETYRFRLTSLSFTSRNSSYSTSRHVWPGINADVRRWARSCIQCQRTKVHHHTVSPLHSFPKPDARFDTVHIDLVGPLPPSQGYTYLLTCVDRFTRWPEAIPLTSITAEDVAKAFIWGWVSRFGTPSTIVTDRGRQFQSNLWTALTTLLGSKRVRTTSYHPQANGLVEHFHRQLKAALKTHPQSTWVESLLLVLLGIRTALKEDLHCTAAELVYGTNLRLPGEFFTSPSSTPTLECSDYVSQLKSRMSQIRPISPRDTTSWIRTCPHVFIRHDAICKPLQPPYNGPYPVVKRTDKYFTVNINGREDTVSLDRLKPAYLDPSHPATSCAATDDTDIICTPTSTPTQDPPPKTTRSGRRVHWPKLLHSYMA